MPQILNQFIRGLHSSILQYVCPLYPNTLQNTVTRARDFESAESETNHAQVVNLETTIIPKIKHVSQHWPISSGSQKRMSATTVVNKGTSEQTATLITITLTNNIPLATVTNDELLAAIFSFDLEETIEIPLFSRAALEEKPITTMYMDAKIDGHAIKLILDSGSAAVNTRIITANRVIKTPIGEINNLPIEINSITVLIKVLVMKATQYQALVRNDWLSKTNTVLDWTMQKLQLSQNSQHT
ncbi:hypothetical protein G9A89_020494 [Geosiphon pyriformis]|nr:hypothetical protein G9A89_020494 [Geosiphon pyriformis]